MRINEANKSRLDGLLLALLAVISLSLAPLFIKIGLNAAVDPVPLLTFRLLAASLVLWFIFSIVWPDLLRIDWPGLLRCGAVAAANATSLLCFYVALTRIDVSIAIVLFSLFPLFALVLLALRGEPLTRLSLIRLGLALTGIYLLVGPGGRINFLGLSLVLATALFYALHLNLVQWHLGGYPAQTVAIYVITWMALFLGVIYLVQTGGQRQSYSTTGWAAILITGLISTALARLAMFAGLKRIGSGQTALFGPLETLLAVLWAILFLGERLSALQWAGGTLVIASALLAVKDRLLAKSVSRE